MNEEPTTPEALLRLADNRQMPDSARPDVTLGELRALIAEARATATPDVALDDVMEGFRARHPNVSVFATATPGLREALVATFDNHRGHELRYDIRALAIMCDTDGGMLLRYEARATPTPGLREALAGILRREWHPETDQFLWASDPGPSSGGWEYRMADAILVALSASGADR